MTMHVVLGAGAIGQGTARELAEAGHEVRLVSRSGSGHAIGNLPNGGSVTPVPADVTDADRLSEIAGGAASVINALNPAQYWKWEELWPPMASAILTAAERSGASLVTVNNLYLYGMVDGPMTEDTPIAPHGRKGEVRARMWRDALALHEAGRIRATELRASDYVGSGMGAQSLLNSYVIKPAMAGRAGWLPMGDPDAVHSWTAGADVARLAARLATEPAESQAWGRPWHVPSAAPRSMAQVASDTAALVGTTPRRPHVLPRFLMDLVGLGYPLVRELKETRHEFEHAFVLDSSRTQRAFGLEPTPWDVTLKETVAYLSETAA
jgi:nucleoside-diphosphate-sugar epimerase